MHFLVEQKWLELTSEYGKNINFHRCSQFKRNDQSWSLLLLAFFLEIGQFSYQFQVILTCFRFGAKALLRENPLTILF